MPVEIDHCGHHGPAGEIDARRAGRDLHLAAASNGRELTVIDDECGVLDGSAAVAGDEPRSFEHGHSGGLRWLTLDLPGARRCKDERRGEE